MCPLTLRRPALFHLLEQNRKDFNRRVQPQRIRALPALQPRDSDTGL
jgi:hypothetical protein